LYFKLGAKIKKMAKKTAIYVRISTQLQHTDRQLEELNKIAEIESYDVVDTYIDVLSGFKDDEFRPQLKRLLEDAQKNKYEIVLFSEFSRLSRKVSDLTKFIEEFQANNIELYFQKQNQWVRKNNDLGTRILIQVLGVVSEYEIELFKERSISGKISAVKNRGINLGGLTAYGFKSEEGSKKLIIDEYEATIIRKIFTLYSEGKTAQYICDILNSEGIKSPYNVRLESSKNKRAEKGITEKNYKKLDVENLVWVASSLNKILKNPLYTGQRSINIKKKNTEGEAEYIRIDIAQNEDIRIISDELFLHVQNQLKENTLRKDTAVKHPSLLKNLLVCGCCGRNFVNSLANGTFRYMCFGKIKNTKTRQVNCKNSLEYAQYKLDGLVIQLVIYRLADNNYQLNIKDKIQKLNIESSDINKIIIQKKTDVESEENSWGEYIMKSIKFKVSDRIINTKALNHKKLVEQLTSEISKFEMKKATIHKQINSLNTISVNKDIYSEIHRIQNDKHLLKQLVDEYIEKITTYPVYDKYSLIIISLKDGGEIWGTIKSAKYKNEELFLLPSSDLAPKYICQLLVNDERLAEYHPETKMVDYFGNTKTIEYLVGEKTSKSSTEIIKREGKNPIININYIEPDPNQQSEIVEVPYLKIDKGTYPIKDFIELLMTNEMTGEFSPYDFHFDELDSQRNKLKDIEYRKKNAEKKNNRAKELRKIRKKN
jgi:DNA invertase Pin-like site-specific DNA recombinase